MIGPLRTIAKDRVQQDQINNNETKLYTRKNVVDGFLVEIRRRLSLSHVENWLTCLGIRVKLLKSNNKLVKSNINLRDKN